MPAAFPTEHLRKLSTPRTGMHLIHGAQVHFPEASLEPLMTLQPSSEVTFYRILNQPSKLENVLWTLNFHLKHAVGDLDTTGVLQSR